MRYPGQTKGSTQRIAITALGNTITTGDDGITAPVVVVQTFNQLEQVPVEVVREKVGVFNYPLDEPLARGGRWNEAYSSAVQFRNEGPARAAQKGAVAALVR